MPDSGSTTSPLTTHEQARRAGELRNLMAEVVAATTADGILLSGKILSRELGQPGHRFAELLLVAQAVIDDGSARRRRPVARERRDDPIEEQS